MISTRPNRKMLGIVSGLLILALGLFVVCCRKSQSIGIVYLGMRDTPWPEPRPLFVITNPLPYRITWTILAPEFELPSGWTTTAVPSVRFGGEKLEPGGHFEIYGIGATNVAYRYPVLWGLDPVEANQRPKWKKAADKWCERIGIGPMFLPYGVRRSPVIPPKSSNKVTGTNASGILKSKMVATAR